MTGASPTRFSRSFPWRILLYGAYLLLRLWGLHADKAFPTWDGAVYFQKAAWMAADPLTRIWPTPAFDYLWARPPAPMWLALPGMVVWPGFAMFAAMLMVWQLVGVEIAARGLCGRGDALRRDGAAAILLCGLGLFFTGSQLFYVDALLTAQTMAAVGLAVAWVRRADWRLALGCGLVAALAIATKPAGVATAGAVALGAGAAYIVRRRLTAGSWLGVWRCGPGWQAHAAAAGGPPALAGLAILTTPYGNVFTAFREPMQKVTLWRRVPEGMVSLEGMRNLAQVVCETVGLPLLAALTVAGLWAALRIWRRHKVSLAPLSVALLAFAVLSVGSAALPFKEHRYVSPMVAAGLCVVVVAISRAWRNRSVLLILGLLAVLWRGLVVSNAIDYRPWLRGHAFRIPLHESRAVLDTLDDEAGALGCERPCLLFATDTVLEAEAVELAETLRELGVEAARRDLGIEEAFRVARPRFPDFGPAPMAEFPRADFLLVRPPQHFAFEEGSTNADWQALNNSLWEAATAESLGWREAIRTSGAALYVSSGAGPPPEIAARRLAFLRGICRSPEASRILDRSLIESQ